MHMRARYFVITTKSTWTSTLTLMTRVYGFATCEVFVIDLEEKLNRLGELAESGCYVACEPHIKRIAGRLGVVGVGLKEDQSYG